MDFQPIFLIGAARSGTKIVRDVLAHHPSIDKVPYDVNYLWRLGHEHILHDELAPHSLTPKVARRIREKVGMFSTGNPFLVEKTVSNCLRVPFVARIFPEALFIHLVRDGLDVVESAYRQWTARPNWRYILKKASSFPLFDAYGYALAYGIKTVRRLFQPTNRMAVSWGPRYAGIDEDINGCDLLVVCATQWVRCVETAMRDLQTLPEGRVFTLRYEDFANAPRQQLAQVAQFLGLNRGFSFSESLQVVSPDHIGKGRRTLDSDQADHVLRIIGHTRDELGYG